MDSAKLMKKAEETSGFVLTPNMMLLIDLAISNAIRAIMARTVQMSEEEIKEALEKEEVRRKELDKRREAH